MREHELQKQIIDALVLAGFDVKETTAYKQKGPSGTDKGISDLLVRHSFWKKGVSLCLEVKRQGSVRWSSPEQKAAHDQGWFYVVQSPKEALIHCQSLFSELAEAWRDPEGCHSASDRMRRTLEALR